MATLSTVSQGIVDAIIASLSYVGAPSAITIAHKEEGPLEYWLNDEGEASSYPFVSIHMTSWPTFGRMQLKQMEVRFTVEIHILDKAKVNENPYQLVRQEACYIVDNIMHTGDLGLDYVDNLELMSIRVPSAAMQGYFMSMGRGQCAAVIDLAVTCTYNPYDVGTDVIDKTLTEQWTVG